MYAMMEDEYISNKAADRINRLDEILVYGAGIMGKALKLCFESQPYKRHIRCFIVSDTEKNPHEISGTPVIGLEDAAEYRACPIIVALNEGNMPGALKGLREHGFEDLIPLNAAGDDWSNIKKNYFLSNRDKCYIPFEMLPEEVKICHGEQ